MRLHFPPLQAVAVRLQILHQAMATLQGIQTSSQTITHSIAQSLREQATRLAQVVSVFRLDPSSHHTHPLPALPDRS